MSDENSFYKILGVNKNASESDIKHAFIKNAKKIHPDKNINNPKNEEEFKKLKEAYDVLSNPQYRNLYDSGNYDKNTLQGQQNSDTIDFSEVFGQHGDFGDIFQFMNFENVFSQMKRHSSTHILKNISIKNLYNRETISSTFEKKYDCLNCLNNANSKNCKNCDGSGIVQKVGFIQPGLKFLKKEKCNSCSCKICNGSGLIVKTTKFKIDLKNAINLEYVICPNEGDIINKRKQDLLVRINPISYEGWEWDEKNNVLSYNLEITLVDVLCGLYKTIHLLNGNTAPIIVAGVLNFQNPLMLDKKYGIPLKEKDGTMRTSDIIVKFELKLPNFVNNEQIKNLKPLLEKLYNI